MRGFRASRASQNSKSARFGREWNPQNKNDVHFHGNAQQPQTRKIELPAWLKMRDSGAAANSFVKKAPVAKKHLRLVSSTATPVKAATPTAAAKTPAARKTGVTTAKTTTATARKRKAA